MTESTPFSERCLPISASVFLEAFLDAMLLILACRQAGADLIFEGNVLNLCACLALPFFAVLFPAGYFADQPDFSILRPVNRYRTDAAHWR